MKTFVSEGATLSVVAPAGGLTSGVGALIGAALFGISATTVAAGAEGVVVTEGVFDHAAKAGEAWVVGAVIYFDPATKEMTTTAGALRPVGVAVAAKGAAEVVGRLKLVPKTA